MPRAAVVAALAIATVALPGTGTLNALQGEGLSTLLSDGDATTEMASGSDIISGTGFGPSTFSILQQSVAQPSTPPELAQRLSSQDRLAAVASRSQVRSSLPGCDASVFVAGSNGQLDSSKLCALPNHTGMYLQPEAAVAFTEMSRAYELEFGVPIRVVDAYRTLSRQGALRSTKGGMAAPVGYSNHGWGYAIDLDRSTYSGAGRWAWLQKNAIYYGFGNPDWAKGAKYEPWHWEYMTGVIRVDNNWNTGYEDRLASVDEDK